MHSKTLSLRLRAAIPHIGTQTLDPALEIAPATSSLSLESMQEAITADSTALFSELSTLFATFGPRAKLPAIQAWGLDEALIPGGYAGLPLARQPHLFVSQGAILALDELLLTGLTSPTFFTFDDLYDPNDGERTRAPPHVLRVELEGPERFHDYSWLRKIDSKDSAHALLTTMPLSGWRLCQFELLRELALQWLCLHEAAHWLTGHVGLLASSSSAGSVSLQLADPDIQFGAAADQSARVAAAIARILAAHNAPRELTPTAARKCIEYQADHVGFQLLEFLQRNALAAGAGAFARYERAMKELSLPGIFDAVSVLNEAARARALLIAAGAVILLIERASKFKAPQTCYPLPLARLLNLQTALISTSSFSSRYDGEAILSSELINDRAFLSFVRDSLARSLIDLTMLTRVLELPPFVDPNTREFPASTRDLLQLFNPEVRSEMLETEAGREFFSLYEVNQVVSELSEPYGRIDPELLQVAGSRP